MKMVTVIVGWGAWDGKGKYRCGQRKARRSVPKLLQDIGVMLEWGKNHPSPKTVVVPDWMARLLKSGKGG